MNLFQFGSEMQDQLFRNAHKTGWQGMTAKRMLYRLRQEVAELSRAIAQGKPAEDIIAEAADVANFAYFIADNAENDHWRKQNAAAQETRE